MSAGAHTQLTPAVTRGGDAQRGALITPRALLHVRGAPVHDVHNTSCIHRQIAASDDTRGWHGCIDTGWECKQSEGNPKMKSALLDLALPAAPLGASSCHGWHAVAIIIHACFNELLGFRHAMGRGSHLGKRALGKDSRQLRRVSHRDARLRPREGKKQVATKRAALEMRSVRNAQR